MGISVSKCSGLSEGVCLVLDVIRETVNGNSINSSHSVIEFTNCATITGYFIQRDKESLLGNLSKNITISSSRVIGAIVINGNRLGLIISLSESISGGKDIDKIILYLSKGTDSTVCVSSSSFDLNVKSGFVWSEADLSTTGS